MHRTKHRLALAALILAGAGATPAALSFCGFYVAQDDGPLFNHASKVVLARIGDQTTLTMASDYTGKASEFAIVIPIPDVPRKDDIRVVSASVIDRVDKYTEPRVAAYDDPPVCRPEVETVASGQVLTKDLLRRIPSGRSYQSAVRVEAAYDVGEYDIVILSAKDSDALEHWLHREKYNIPDGAGAILDSYVRQNMKFFVAKVDVEELAKLETPFLRPIQVDYESPKFMLPIRLGMVNADGPQDLLIYALTPTGRIETTNYRTTRMPTDVDVPPYVASDFSRFYGSAFDRQVERHGMSTVFLEYAWPLTQVCDPCSSEMLTTADLQPLGASWSANYHTGSSGGFVTRLHVRYDLAHFPEDLVFQETADTSTYQARYVVHRPYTGDTSCEEGMFYEMELAGRQETEVRNLAELTGWDPAEIRQRVPSR